MRTITTLLRTAAVTLAVVAVAAIAAVMLVPVVAGYERYVITSGSMTGTYDTGSVVYAKAVPTADLRVGDVITYAPPAGESPTALVTHRLVAITRAPTGRLVYRTKGDANPDADPWRFELSAARQARVSFGVPYAGYVFIALGDRRLRMLLIGGPALLVALSVLLGMIREARAEARSDAQAVAGAAPPEWVRL
jgi:signal peptidase